MDHCKREKAGPSSCSNTLYDEFSHVEINLNELSNNLNDVEIIRLTNCSSLPQALSVIIEKLQNVSLTAVEIVLPSSLNEVTAEDFTKIQKLFKSLSLCYFFIDSSSSTSNNFLFWIDCSQQQNFLQVEEEKERKFSSYARKQILSVKNAQEGSQKKALINIMIFNKGQSQKNFTMTNAQNFNFKPARESMKNVKDHGIKTIANSIESSLAFQPPLQPKSANPEELFELSGSFNFDNILSMSDSQVHEFKDDRGFSLLMLASEAGRNDIVQNLIDRGEDVNFSVDGKTAISLAYKEGHYDVMLALLKANSKYPDYFYLDQDDEEEPDELKVFVDASFEMHKRIFDSEKYKEEELKAFLLQNVEANPSVRHFYDTENTSLLCRAIESRNFSIYEFLLSHNIFLGPDESMDVINEGLTEEEREKLSDINLRISPSLMTEPMMILMRNTKLSPDSPKERETEFLNFIKGAFDSLFMIPAIAIVLKIVAASRNFKIIFDFKRDSVTFLDPKSEPYCDGLMYFCGKLYIGAKDMLDPASAHKVVSVIAHELTHYAMLLVYDNNAKPYKEGDLQTMQTFKEISNDCKEKSSAEEIVELVYECYERSEQSAELIVRVPHMIAYYINNVDVLTSLRSTFQNLFDFYEQTCVPEMEAELPNIEEKFCPERQKARKLKRQKRWIWFLIVFIMIGSVLSAVGLYLFYNPTISWADLNEEERSQVRNATVKFKEVTTRMCKIFADDSEVYWILPSELLKKILKHDIEVEHVELTNYLELCQKVFLTWSNMTEDLRGKFLTINIEFQGQNVSIINITASDTTLQHLSPTEIRKIFLEDRFQISVVVKQTVVVYVERFFVPENVEVLSEKKRNSMHLSPKLRNSFVQRWTS